MARGRSLMGNFIVPLYRLISLVCMQPCRLNRKCRGLTTGCIKTQDEKITVEK
ncbi:hypothetical protein P5673_033752 [Acropora cervicornis]|uniref:Uncharacterized protein n=1 Tax=Acropora cervicornis TaxID=6130 RepID=A0AAD9PPH5_ACRCE|nr:hypothetical protein P5673_033752 [Acropora cervicornis]